MTVFAIVKLFAIKDIEDTFKLHRDIDRLGN